MKSKIHHNMKKSKILLYSNFMYRMLRMALDLKVAQLTNIILSFTKYHIIIINIEQNYFLDKVTTDHLAHKCLQP